MEGKSLNLVEIPQQMKIVEIRNLSGQLKVFGAWYLWQAIFGIAISIFLFYANIEFKKGNYPDIEIILRGTIAIVFMKYRMDTKARKRWQKKYER